MVRQPPEVMLPSHGPIVSEPKTQLAGYARKLRQLKKRYVRGYPVSHLKDRQRNPLSRPTVVPEIFQVMPHLFKSTGRVKAATFVVEWKGYRLQPRQERRRAFR
jgi:hypothetical protein